MVTCDLNEFRCEANAAFRSASIGRIGKSVGVWTVEAAEVCGATRSIGFLLRRTSATPILS